MYLRLGLHVQIRLYYVLPYKAKISAQQGIGCISDRCIVYLGLTMPNLQKKGLLIFEIFNTKINLLAELSFVTLTIHLCNGLNDKKSKVVNENMILDTLEVHSN